MSQPDLGPAGAAAPLANQPVTYIFAHTGGGFPSELFNALSALARGGQPLQVAASGSDGGAAGKPAEMPAAPRSGQDEEKGRREPLPRGEAERRALALLAEHPDQEYTPGQIAREIGARGCRDLMSRLCARGIVRVVNEHPLTYRAAPPPRKRSRAKKKQ